MKRATQDVIVGLLILLLLTFGCGSDDSGLEAASSDSTGSTDIAGAVTERAIQEVLLLAKRSSDLALSDIVEKLGTPAQRGRNLTKSSDHAPGGGGSMHYQYLEEVELCVWLSESKTYVFLFHNCGLKEVKSYLPAYTRIHVK